MSGDSAADGVDEIWDDWAQLGQHDREGTVRRWTRRSPKAVGDKSGSGDSTGHASGRRIVALPGTRKGDRSQDDAAHVRTLTGSGMRQIQTSVRRSELQIDEIADVLAFFLVSPTLHPVDSFDTRDRPKSHLAGTHLHQRTPLKFHLSDHPVAARVREREPVGLVVGHHLDPGHDRNAGADRRHHKIREVRFEAAGLKSGHCTEAVGLGEHFNVADPQHGAAGRTPPTGSAGQGIVGSQFAGRISAGQFVDPVSVPGSTDAPTGCTQSDPGQQVASRQLVDFTVLHHPARQVRPHGRSMTSPLPFTVTGRFACG